MEEILSTGALCRTATNQLPEQLVVQLGSLREVLAVHPEDPEDLLPVSAHQKDSRNNHYGILFSFEPRRKLPDNLRSQWISPFFWAHNGILKDEELIRPSKWQMQPPPNHEYTNSNEVWIPPMGFYWSLVSQEAAVKSAAQFAGVHSPRPLCIGGVARLRQPHCVIPRGGTYADIAASHYCDCIHAKDGRWKLQSSIAVPNYLGMFW